jgi:hypothetical protein
MTCTMRSEGGGPQRLICLTLEADLRSAFRNAWGAWIARRVLRRWWMRIVTRHGRSDRFGYNRSWVVTCGSGQAPRRPRDDRSLATNGFAFMAWIDGPLARAQTAVVGRLAAPGMVSPTALLLGGSRILSGRRLAVRG